MNVNVCSRCKNLNDKKGKGMEKIHVVAEYELCYNCTAELNEIVIQWMRHELE